MPTKPRLLLPFSLLLSSMALVGCTGPSDAPSLLLRELTPPEAPAFHHEFATDTAYYVPESIAGGVALLDYDDDGDLDVYLVNGAGHSGRLFRRDGSVFVDVTDASGLGAVSYGIGVAAADYDNDGLVDLYLTSVGPDALYRNTGHGFVEVTGSAGVSDDAWGSSAAWLDYDADGWLDLYVANYLELVPGVACSDRAGAPEYCGPTAYAGAPDRLYHNLGDGRFEDVSIVSGIGRTRGRGLGVVALDADGDGRVDIYVANDGEPNFLWENRGNGTFVERALEAGVAVNGSGQSEAGMGIAVGDIDLDGHSDIFVTHLAGESNTLYRNRGDGSFVDETARRGLHVPSLPYTGFGTAFADLDNDGDLDLLVANGRINRGEPVTGAPAGMLRPYAEPNSVYLNDGSGRFEEQSHRQSDFAGRPGMSRGLSVGDFDDDGGLDVLVTETGREARLFRNVAERGHWIGFRVIDPRHGGRDAIGARLELWASGRDSRVAHVRPHVGYLSTSDARVHFGLGAADRIDSLRVTWPDGHVEMFSRPAADRYHVVRRGSGRSR